MMAEMEKDLDKDMEATAEDTETAEDVKASEEAASEPSEDAEASDTSSEEDDDKKKGKFFKKKDKKIEKQYSEKTRIITNLLEELSRMEKEGERDLDRVSGCFGRIMEEIFAYRKDVWEPTLRRMGFFLGKFIYLMDAYDDVEKDVEKGNYNPFAEEYIMEGFQEKVQQMLVMMMAETCREFEKLPIIKYTDILRNILYSGVWCRFETVSRQRKEKQNQKP